MGTAKTLKYILPAFLMTVLSAGCTEELTYTPGTEEDPDNYGVYFPNQTTATSLDLDPSEDTEVTYKIRRTRYTDAILVPVTVEASEEGIFEIEPIVFGPGEQETEFTVSFDKAETGKEYTCNITIEDPKYVSVYGKRSTSLSISVIRAGWNRLTGAGGETTGKWRDNVISNIYSINISGYNPYPEVNVEIYEREDSKGYYRMKVYGNDLMTTLAGGNSVNFTGRDVWTTVDARDPQKVYIPYQSTGLTVLSDDGEIRFGSYVPENFSMDESAAQYGTMEDGIITFPAQSIMIELTNNSGSFYYGNREGMLRIMLPGITAPDYTVTLAKSEPEAGTVDITATFAEDAAALVYNIVEGTLDDGGASLQAQEMDSNKDSYITEGKIIRKGTESQGTIRIQDMTTNKYTFVGCVYDAEGTMRDYVFLPFGYVASGDSKPLDLTFGLEFTKEYEGQGLSSDNSMKFYAYGSEIESVTYGLFRTSRIDDMTPDNVLDSQGVDFTADELSQLNDGHFSVLLKGLNGDSEYSLLLRASNGYVTETRIETLRTTGTFDPLLEVFYYDDFLDADPDEWSLEYLTGRKWKYYAYNFNEENAVRRLIGTVTMEKNDEISDQTTTILNVEGLSGVKFDKGGEMLGGHMPSSTYFDGYEGVVAISPNPNGTHTIDGEAITIGFIDANEPLYIYYSQYYYMFFGAVADGYLYCVPSPVLEEQGYSFSFLYTGSRNTLYSLMGEMMLVDPDKDLNRDDDEIRTSAALARIADIRRKALQGVTPSNYVELPQFSSAPDSRRENQILNLAIDPMPASPSVKKADVTVSAIPAGMAGTSGSGETVRTGIKARL